MAVILSGGCIRMALMDRRSELIRYASITKYAAFDEKIKELDDALEQLWDARKIELTETV